MNEFLDFQGEVSLYDGDGNLKWTKHNKITYQGRAALLKCLSHSLSINKTSGNNFTDRIDVNSFLCGVAFGRGGNMEGSVLCNNTSFDDVGLFDPVPIRQVGVEELFDGNQLALERYQNYIAYHSADACYIDNNKDSSAVGREDINFDRKRLLYFKKISEVSTVNTMMMENSNASKFKFKSSLVSFIIKIDQEDFKLNSALFKTSFNSISELGLYLGSLQYDVEAIGDDESLDPRVCCQDGENMLYRNFSKEAKYKNCSYFVDGSIPVMFSHITFPAEDIIEPKDLTFKYTVFV